MSDLTLNTEPPFKFIRPERYEREQEIRDNANKRARYLARKYDFRDPVAWTLALAEQGASPQNRLDTTSGTVKKYLNRVAAQYGPAARFPKPEEERGELTEITRSEVLNMSSGMREMWLDAASENLEHVPEELRDTVRDHDVGSDIS